MQCEAAEAQFCRLLPNPTKLNRISSCSKQLYRKKCDSSTLPQPDLNTRTDNPMLLLLPNEPIDFCCSMHESTTRIGLLQ